MANIKSAKKRILVNEKKKNINNNTLKALNTSYKKSKKAVKENDENKAELISDTFKKADKAVSKGLIKQNKANRIKHNLTKEKTEAK